MNPMDSMNPMNPSYWLLVAASGTLIGWLYLSVSWSIAKYDTDATIAPYGSLSDFIEQATRKQLGLLAIQLLLAIFWPLLVGAILVTFLLIPFSWLKEKLIPAKPIVAAVARRATKELRSLSSLLPSPSRTADPSSRAGALSPATHSLSPEQQARLDAFLASFDDPPSSSLDDSEGMEDSHGDTTHTAPLTTPALPPLAAPTDPASFTPLLTTHRTQQPPIKLTT